MEQTNSAAEMPATRPQFLKVLCILSFIGTGLGFISGLWGWWSNHMLAAGTDAVAGAISGSEAGEQMAQSMTAMSSAMGMGPDYFAKQATSSLIIGLLNLVVFLGAMMMWKMKKTGFFIYTGGHVIQIIVPFVVVGGLLGGLTGIMSGIFGVAFIIMYAVNVKHLS